MWHICAIVLLWMGAALPATADEAVWSRRPVKLVALGDSVSAGVGATAGHSYFDLVQAELRRHYPRLEAENIALSGSNSAGLERRLPRVKPAGRDTLGIVVITIGGNDLVHGYGFLPPKECAMYGATLTQALPWIAGFESRLQRVVTTLHERFPGGCEVYLANLYDPTDDRGDIENAPTPEPLPKWPDVRPIFERYNQVLENVRGTHSVDLYHPFLGHGFHHGPAPYWFTDLEHPNDEGHAAMARAFLEQITRYSGSPATPAAPAPKGR